MNEQNQYPHESDGEPRDPARAETDPARPAEAGPTHDQQTSADPGAPGREPGPGTSESWFGDHDEHTRPIPPYQPGGQSGGQPGGHSGYPQSGDPAFYAQPADGKARGRRGVTAAVLVGALVLGGAAGVGGAAAYDQLLRETPTSTTDDAGPFEATNTRAVEDGTVESVAQEVLPSVVKINVASRGGAGSGSGIVLSEDGKILTNNHVVAAGAGDNGSISVSFNDGTTKQARILGTDPLVDIAVIQVEDAEDLTPAALGKSGELQVGQTVVAVGSPFGLNATVTSGIVSALNRPVSVAGEQEQAPQNPFGSPQAPQQGGRLSTTYPAIQTDAAINPGNSGGPLVDMSGRVVGINSSIRTDSAGMGSPGGSIGLGFAIPIDEVLPIVNQLSAGEQPTHARLAVSVSDVRSEELNRGAQLQSVEPGGAAAEAGLQTGDVITKVDEHLIDGSDSLVAIIRGHRPGDEVEITYVRDGEKETATVELGSDAESSDS